MNINKRECRKYINPGFTFKKNDGLLLVKNINHIVHTVIKNIAGRRILIVYFYKRERAAENAAPEYVLFQCGDDYITMQRFDDGTLKWRTASLDNLGKHYAYITKECAFYRQSDEKRVTQFCKNPELKGFDALNRLQDKIMNKRLNIKIRAREQEISERMKSVPPIPHGLKNWIHYEILPQYIFYDYKRGNNPMKAYCTCCCKDIFVSGAKYNGKGKCPNCGKNIKFKSSGKVKRVWDRTTVQSIQKINNNEVILRIYKIFNGLRNWRKPDYHIRECARIFIRQDENKKISIDAYYDSYKLSILTSWKHGNRPKFSFYQYYFESDFCGYLYCKNLPGILSGTPWQYCQIERFHKLDRERLEVTPYFSSYHKYPAIEYLIKLKLTKLAAQIIYKNEYQHIINAEGKNLRETLGVEPGDLPIFQKININADQLELYQQLKKQGIRVDENLLIWYQQHNILSIENLLIPLKYMTQNKLMRYVDEQFESLKDYKTKYGTHRYETPGRILSEYKDYLNMGSKLEYNFADNFVLFPKNLLEAHDQTSKLYDTKKKAILNNLIKDAYKKLIEQYRFTKNGLTLIPPKTAKEIVNEEHTLHHCVSSYVDSVANGRCVILFIRKTDNSKEPFYTLELQNNRIIQVHGKHHCTPTPEVNKFIELWKQKKLLPAKIYNAA